MRSLGLLLLFAVASQTGQAQSYCSPTFQNGCSTWMTQSVSVGDLDWTYNGIDCTAWDQTAMSSSIVPGEPLTMTVVNGNWCGCAVWVDLDNSGTFEETENMYAVYVGGDPSYTYTFPLELPAGTLPGTYRMRVISPWGSDGFSSSSTNGFGPCGNFQYGNFQDFSLEVASTAGIAGSTAEGGFAVVPTHTADLVQVSSDAAHPLDLVTVLTMDGRLVQELPLAPGVVRAMVDLTDQPAGVYLIRMRAGKLGHTARVVKE